MMSESGRRTRRAGVIAAGHGARLHPRAAALKPLVDVAGRPLIDRVLTSIAETGASEVTIIVNEESRAVQRHVTAYQWPFKLRWIVETTPSSMHSFLRVVETLAENGDFGPFLVSTVDTVTTPGAFARFVQEADLHADADMTLALTKPIDDEKPLLVQLGPDGSRIVSIGPAAGASAKYATAGYYSVRAEVLREGESACRAGVDALRVFLARLLRRGYRLDGVPVAASIDVDRPVDVTAAEDFLKRVAG